MSRETQPEKDDSRSSSPWTVIEEKPQIRDVQFFPSFSNEFTEDGSSINSSSSRNICYQNSLNGSRSTSFNAAYPYSPSLFYRVASSRSLTDQEQPTNIVLDKKVTVTDVSDKSYAYEVDKAYSDLNGFVLFQPSLVDILYLELGNLFRYSKTTLLPLALSHLLFLSLGYVLGSSGIKFKLNSKQN